MAALSTLALLSLSAASTFGKYTDQRRAAGAAEGQANYEGGLLDRNAQMSALEATDATRRGHEAELDQRGRNRLLAGEQRASMAGSGVDMGSGSARDVVANDQAIGEFDALTIRNNAAREAWGYDVQASDYRRQADLTRMAGRETARGLRSQSVSTLLTGAGELASIYAAAPKRISRGGTVPTTASPARRPGGRTY